MLGLAFKIWSRKCPRHLIEEKYELQLFYNGLYVGSKNIVNASAGGTISDKTYEEVKELFNKIAKNNSITPAEREKVVMKKIEAVIESDSTNELASQIALLTTQFSTFLKAKSQ